MASIEIISDMQQDAAVQHNRKNNITGNMDLKKQAGKM
jgi:hypothetical protein